MYLHWITCKCATQLFFCVEMLSEIIKSRPTITLSSKSTGLILLLGKEDNIEMAELVDEFVTFYVAGQETTSNLLSFSLVLLLQHPDVLHR